VNLLGENFISKNAEIFFMTTQKLCFKILTASKSVWKYWWRNWPWVYRFSFLRL